MAGANGIVAARSPAGMSVRAVFTETARVPLRLSAAVSWSNEPRSPGDAPGPRARGDGRGGAIGCLRGGRF